MIEVVEFEQSEDSFIQPADAHNDSEANDGN